MLVMWQKTTLSMNQWAGARQQLLCVSMYVQYVNYVVRCSRQQLCTVLLAIWQEAAIAVNYVAGSKYCC
jgi:hypothetical protein